MKELTLKQISSNIKNGLMSSCEAIGKKVNVGFLRLEITGFSGSDTRLKNTKGERYEFSPYNGLFRVE